MTIVLLEHFTSVAARRPDAALRAEGGAMRDALADDLQRLPGVTLDLVERRHGRAGSFRERLRRADAALVIAPETGGVLERLSRAVEVQGRVLLGSSSRVSRLAGDKLATARLLASAGIPTPATETIPFRGAADRLAGRTLPFVLKPRDGCGGRGVVLVRRRRHQAAAIAAVRRATRGADLLVQEYLLGEDASVSVIASDSGGTPALLSLGLNRQSVRRGRRFEYSGGQVGWRHPMAERAVEAARAAVAALAETAGGGVRGYLGVDLVLGRMGPSVVEINPRLTTSYLGLRRAVRWNLAGLILDAARGRPLPARIVLRSAWRFDGGGVVPWRSIAAGTSAASI